MTTILDPRPRPRQLRRLRRHRRFRLDDHRRRRPRRARAAHRPRRRRLRRLPRPARRRGGGPRRRSTPGAALGRHDRGRRRAGRRGVDRGRLRLLLSPRRARGRPPGPPFTATLRRPSDGDRDPRDPDLPRQSGRPLRWDPAFNGWVTGPLASELAPCCPAGEAEPCKGCGDRKPAPAVHGTATLTLTISDQHYRVRPIRNELFGATGRAYRLRRIDNDAVYDLAETAHGPTCDCRRHVPGPGLQARPGPDHLRPDRRPRRGPASPVDLSNESGARGAGTPPSPRHQHRIPHCPKGPAPFRITA